MRGFVRAVNADGRKHRWVRQGVREMIVDALSDAKGVVRRSCATPLSQTITVP